jgi:hypothetical protein
MLTDETMQISYFSVVEIEEIANQINYVVSSSHNENHTHDVQIDSNGNALLVYSFIMFVFNQFFIPVLIIINNWLLSNALIFHNFKKINEKLYFCKKFLFVKRRSFKSKSKTKNY